MRKNVRSFTIDKGSGGSKGCPEKAEGIKGGSLLLSVPRFRGTEIVLPDPEGILHGYDTAASGLDIRRNLCG